MPFSIIRDDITRVRADAIVNTANPDPVIGGGTDSAIYKAAGADELLAARKKIGHIARGEACVTPAYRLHADFIIHTAGPVWKGGDAGEMQILASCYRKSLLLAYELGCVSIAFPLISTGVYGFPKDRALDVALEEFRTFLDDHDMNIFLVVFDRKAFELSESLVDGVRQYIDEKYVDEQREVEYSRRRRDLFRRDEFEAAASCEASDEPLTDESFDVPAEDDALWYNSAPDFGSAPAYHTRPKESSKEAPGAAKAPGMSKPSGGPKIPGISKPSVFHVYAGSEAQKAKKKPAAKSSSARKLEDVIGQVGENFQEMLLRLIDERGLTDSEVYKKANLDRKLFSKIRCNPDYTPKKTTALALAIALGLTLDETVDLLARAGIALSPGSKFDIIIEYCIEHRMYNIFEVNEVLFEFGQQQLGAVG